jgi:hypothetical protein
MSPYRALYGRECTQVNKMLVADVLEENMDLDSYVSDLALTMIAVWESLGVTIFETSMYGGAACTAEWGAVYSYL